MITGIKGDGRSVNCSEKLKNGIGGTSETGKEKSYPNNANLQQIENEAVTPPKMKARESEKLCC